MGKRRSAGEVGAMVREFEASGLTRGEYSRRRGIAVGTLDAWRRRVARPRWVEVEVRNGESTGHFSLQLANGRRIESGWRFADEDLARLIRLAERA